MTQDQLDLASSDDLFDALARRWPDILLIAQKPAADNQFVQYRRRAGNPFTLLGCLVIEVTSTQRDLLIDQSNAPHPGDDV